MKHLLENFKVYHFAVSNEVITPLQLPADQPGKAIRGSFYQALWQRFCNNKIAPTCADCSLNQSCPVSNLVAPLRDEYPRGRDIVRPYTIRSPQLQSEATEWLSPGQKFDFGITIFGKMLKLLPYIALTLPTMGQNGLGSWEQTTRQRGKFKTISLKTVNMLNGQQQELLSEKNIVKPPSLELAMTHQSVSERVKGLSGDRIQIELLTPLRLIDETRLVRQFAFRPFFQRLLDRLLALQNEYGIGNRENPEFNLVEYKKLLELAEKVAIQENKTHWQDIASYSTRQHKSTPIGGLTGSVTLVLEGDSSILMPYLVWGEAVQVGKDVVKGNGCYRLHS